MFSFKKSFTLIELLISTVIIWILVVLIFKIYMLICNISIRVENQKTVDNGMLYVSQVFENISDKYDIDYSKYSSLSDSYGLTGKLFLTWNWNSLIIYSTWNCDLERDFFREKDCRLQMKKNSEIVNLTDKRKIYIKNLFFKIMPYDDIENYNLEFENIYHNWFGVFWEFYVKRFSNFWPYNVKISYENFYNIRNY